MSSKQQSEPKEFLKQIATAIELINQATTLVGSALRRINDRYAQRECFDANQFLFSAIQRLMENNMPNEYLEAADAKIIIEQIRTWRNKIEELLENRKNGYVSIIDFLPKEIIYGILELGREAEFHDAKTNGRTH